MKPEDFDKIWEEIATSGSGSRAYSMTRRRVAPDAAPDLFLCVIWPAGHRGLLVEVDGFDEAMARRLPACRGIRIRIVPNDPKKPVRTTMGIELEDNDLADIFSVLSADLFSVLETEEGGIGAISRCLDRISHWQGLFDKLPAEGLSLERQRGLFGELWFLRQFILEVVPPLESLTSWQGPRGNPQDYVLKGVGVEVKTTITKRHSRLKISGEKQLDDAPFRSLYLVNVRMDEADVKGTTLPELVGDVRSAVEGTPAARYEFDLRLAEAGYLDRHAAKYGDNRFFVTDMNIFEVREGFPRLTEADLPPGVGDISYTIIANDLSEFAVDSAHLLSDLGAEN